MLKVLRCYAVVARYSFDEYYTNIRYRSYRITNSVWIRSIGVCLQPTKSWDFKIQIIPAMVTAQTVSSAVREPGMYCHGLLDANSEIMLRFQRQNRGVENGLISLRDYVSDVRMPLLQLSAVYVDTHGHSTSSLDHLHNTRGIYSVFWLRLSFEPYAFYKQLGIRHD